MASKLGAKDKPEVIAEFAKTDASRAIRDFGDYFRDTVTEHELAKILQDQEIMYQSFQKITCQDGEEASVGNTSKNDDVLDAAKNTYIHNHEENVDLKSQLENDEAVARALQEEEDKLAVTSSSGSTSPPDVAVTTSSTDGISTVTSRLSTSTETATSSQPQAIRENDINPDHMTYEELQSLEESVGVESKGLSDEVISYLKVSTYKVGFFSKKDKHEDCSICCMPYKNRQKLINLPCKHRYHSECITKWLKINKICPVCIKEVFG